MFQLSPQSIRTMNDYEVDYRCAFRAGQILKDEQGNVIRDDNRMPVIGPFRCACEIIDRTTKEIYITEHGDDPYTAVENAMRRVPLTPKPKTRAQILSELSPTEIEAKKDAEISELKKQLADLTTRIQQIADAKPAEPETSMPESNSTTELSPPEVKTRRPRQAQPQS